MRKNISNPYYVSLPRHYLNSANADSTISLTKHTYYYYYYYYYYSGQLTDGTSEVRGPVVAVVVVGLVTACPARDV